MFAASKSGKSAAGGGTTDPSFPYVPLLLETTSTNGQQNNTFLDSSTNNFTITRNGTPTQGSITPYWPNGQWSNYFSSGNYINAASNAAFGMGTGDFTIEAWIFATAAFSGYQAIFGDGFTTSSLFFGNTAGGFGLRAGSVADILVTTAPTINQWVHVACTRSGTTVRLFYNGVQQATTTSVTNFATQTAYVGNDGGGSAFPGYISNFRLVKGVAVYTTTPFTPSTTPLTATQSANVNGNPSAAITGTQTSLLTCQSNRSIDNSTNNFTITRTGTPTVQAFQPFSPTASYTTALYGGSGYFNGTSDWLSIPDNAAFALGSGDFTAECWIYPTSLANEAIIIGQWSGDLGGSGLNFALLFSSGSTGYLRLITSSNGSSVLFDLSTSTTSFTISLNTWQHIAAVRSGNTFTLYVNGVSRATTTNASALFDATNAFTIGAESNTQSQYFTGYISNARLAKGTAVYTGAFTPPTLAPLTTAGSTSAASYTDTTNVNTSFAASSTALLLNFTNAGIYDAAVQNDVITVGDAQASTTQSKWSPTSMKYDGTGDWLTSIDGPQLQLGTGDFTIEGWVYLSAVSVVYGILSKGTATTGWSVNVTALNKLQFSYTASVLTGATSLATGTWYYFAVVRSGSATGNLKIYLNGTADATSGGAVTDNFNQTSILYVGADRIGSSALNGYLQDVRITKAARTITTPTAAFPTR